MEINKQFVTYEIALKLKELGFDEKCLAVFTETGQIVAMEQSNEKYCTEINYAECCEDFGVCLAPLWQQAIDWFRENHKIIIEPCIDINNLYEIHIYDGSSKYFINNDTEQGFHTYEEARKQAILKAIEICQQ